VPIYNPFTVSFFLGILPILYTKFSYLDPAKIDLSEYKGREADGILFVDHAGEILHRLERSEG